LKAFAENQRDIIKPGYNSTQTSDLHRHENRWKPSSDYKEGTWKHFQTIYSIIMVLDLYTIILDSHFSQ